MLPLAGNAIKESQVNKLLNIVVRALIAAAHGRAMSVMRKQAEVAKPWKVEYRANAGGWN